jgi:amidohydrolase
LKVGQVGYVIGPALAAVDSYSVTVKGQQSHGAMPHEGIDPIVMAAQVILAFQTIPSRTLDPLQPAVVTVGMIHGGERSNIIPMEVRMQGTVRTYDPGVRETIEKRMNEILDGITRASGGSYEMNYRHGADATVNNPALTRWMVPSLQAALGEDNVMETPPTMGAEDFSVYAQEVPGLFYWLGTHKEGTVTGPIHSPTFRADDGAVEVGMRAMSNVVMDYLIRRAKGDKP